MLSPLLVGALDLVITVSEILFLGLFCPHSALHSVFAGICPVCMDRPFQAGIYTLPVVQQT